MSDIHHRNAASVVRRPSVWGQDAYPLSLASRSSRRDSRQRVLHLVDSLNIGGTESQMVQVVLRQKAAGQRVTVGCLRLEGPLLRLLQDAGVLVVEFRKEKTLLSLSGIRQLLCLVRFLYEGRFRVVHAHDLWANLLGVPAARLARVPVIIASRRYLADLDWYKPWRSKIVDLIYRACTYVVVNSESVKALLLNHPGLPADKIRVIYNGVNAERFAGAQAERQKLLSGLPCHAKLVAVLANMYSPVKGHATLVAAAEHVCQRAASTIFLMIGDGPERSRLEQQAAALGLSRHFLFLGRRCDVPELLACCDLSVLPSEAEALPNALLEAMSAGLPVVATSVGGSAEIIENGVDGLLVPPKSPDLLSKAILTLLQDPSLGRSLGCAAQKKMRCNFSFDRVVAEFEHLYGWSHREISASLY